MTTTTYEIRKPGVTVWEEGIRTLTEARRELRRALRALGWGYQIIAVTADPAHGRFIRKVVR